MAIKKYFTEVQARARLLAEKTYRSLKEVELDLTKISEGVDESLSNLKQFQKSVMHSSMFVLDVDNPSPAGSLKPKKDSKLRSCLVRL
jgi:hypothetical protein